MKSVWVRKRLAARAKTRIWLVAIFVVYVLLVSSGLILNVLGSSSVEYEKGGAGSVWDEGRFQRGQNRPKRQARVSRENRVEFLTADAGDDDNNETCTPRAINNFPDNFFSLKDTQDGGVFVHILISLYLFAALAIVCDDYFVPALERICEDLGLQEDVAGATFMAAGSSAPELCTSIVGVFIAESDVGVGTIVGSAVFNILFIVGLCALAAGMVVHLTWYPLLRDTLFYLLSVLALVVVIEDSKVMWYEALIMLVMYGLYILLMYFNRRLEHRVTTLLARFKSRFDQGSGQSDDEKAALLGTSGSIKARHQDSNPSTGADEAETGFSSSAASRESKQTEENTYESPWEIPESLLGRIYLVATTPIRFLCYFTIPDCRRPGVWRRLYMLTFFVSVLWISGYTYMLVWMITIAGDALGIPDTVMGLTLLAAGTSLPDCLASIMVARDGFGDMAVSNSIGSNVFDILLCLGLPWLIQTSAVNRGDSLEINSSGLLYSSSTLLATVVFLLVSVAVNRWRLTKPYGAICLVVYLLVITLSSLFELNVFADLNPRACPR